MLQARPRTDDGFTLIELLVTMSIGAVLSGLAGTSLAHWSASNAHSGARDEVVSALRNTAQRALSEGRTYCVAFASDGTWKTYRKECSSSGVLTNDGQGLGSDGETLTPAFTYDSSLAHECTVPSVSTATSCAYFYPRGTASAGEVVLQRGDRDPYTVIVEQLTSRVYSE